MAKIRIFRTFNPPQLFFPIGKNGLGGCAGRVSGSCITWYRSFSVLTSGLGVKGEKPPKTAILGLWDVTPPPLWDAKTRDPRRFHVGIVPRVRAKFGEDPSVNKGSYLSGGRHIQYRSKPTEVRIVTFVSGFRPASGLRPGQGSATASRGAGSGGRPQRTR